MTNYRKFECNNGNDKRYDRIRRTYNSPSFPMTQYNKGIDKTNGKNRGKGKKAEEGDRLMATLADAIPPIKELLERIAKDHQRLAEAEERRSHAEERKAEAAEKIAEALKSFLENGAPAGLMGLSPSPPVCEKPGKKQRETVVGIIDEMRRDGATYRQIAAHLDTERLPTFSGKGKWHAQTIHRICQSEDIAAEA